MEELLDLSYYKVLPAQQFSTPRYLINEITNEIEYIANPEFYDGLIDYCYSKICETLDLFHEPVKWATDLRGYKDTFVTVSQFDLNKEWCLFGDDELFKSIHNKLELECNILFIELLGGNTYNDEPAGFIEDNKFKKSFNSNCMFEFDLALYLAGDERQDLFKRDYEEYLLELDKEMMRDLNPYIEKFISLKRSDWDNIFEMPSTPKYNKGKVWIIDKIMDAKQALIEHRDK